MELKTNITNGYYLSFRPAFAIVSSQNPYIYLLISNFQHNLSGICNHFISWQIHTLSEKIVEKWCKAVTGAVSFPKLHICTFRVYIKSILVLHLLAGIKCTSMSYKGYRIFKGYHLSDSLRELYLFFCKIIFLFTFTAVIVRFRGGVRGGALDV